MSPFSASKVSPFSASKGDTQMSPFQDADGNADSEANSDISSPERVTSRTQKGDTRMSPQPSLTVSEPSTFNSASASPSQATEFNNSNSRLATANRSLRQAEGNGGAALRLAEEVFDYWRAKLHPRAKLTVKRRKYICARLRDGYTVEQLKRAVDGCAASSFHQGDNEEGRLYDDITTIFRAGHKVEQHIAYAESNAAPFESDAP